jgi:hypothetical protein
LLLVRNSYILRQFPVFISHNRGVLNFFVDRYLRNLLGDRPPLGIIYYTFFFFFFYYYITFSYSFQSTIFRTGSGLSGEEYTSPGSNSGPLGRRVEMIARLEEFSSMEFLALLATSSVIGSL